MNRNRSRWILVSFLCLMALAAAAQKSKTQKPAKKPAQKTTTQKPATQKTTPSKPEKSFTPNAAEDEKKVRDMVAFLEFMLNTLGSAGTSARDKEVLITQSYSKVFRDAKVQVEDDLDTERKVITNKDVVAYLKDVDFFFNDVHFEFTIDNIQSGAIADGKTFYKVSLRRNLKGTNAEGEPVNNTMPRYLEFNYDPDDQDLRIVSIYTNQFNEKDALTNWWKELSYEWQEIFQRAIHNTDSVSLGDIKKIRALESLNLSNNAYIQTLDPITDFSSLKVLDISHTAIGDLSPARNLTALTEFNASYTRITDLSPLKYSSSLVKLNVSHTPVSDIAVVEKMPRLQTLDIGHTAATDFSALAFPLDLVQLNAESTRISDLSPIQSLTKLSTLDVSGTSITDLAPLKDLKTLTTLDIDSTAIRSVAPLSGLNNLAVISLNASRVADLQPLQKLSRLEKVYADLTAIPRDAADAFRVANPNVLVVFDSKDLKAWWDALPDAWKNVVGKTAGFGLNPAKEELAKVSTVDSIDFQGNAAITDLEPLRKLMRLQVILAAKTGIDDITPLKDHRDIRYLDISETAVTDLSVVSGFRKLTVLQADKSKIEKIDPLFEVASLEKLYADNTMVHDIIAQELLEKNPKCLVIYKTIHLNRWWKNLSADWRAALRTQMSNDTTTSRENLHGLAERETLAINNAPVSDLTALSEFVRVKELHFTGTGVTDITPIANFKTLKSLRVTNGPLQQIAALGQLTSLEELDISNTPIDEIKPVGSLTNLRKFNVAGTQIKRLDPLETLVNLEELDCSNTRVTKLDPIANLPLKTLKCYNTKVSDRAVENFKKSHPECNVMYYR